MDITLKLTPGHLFDVPTRRAAADTFGLCQEHLCKAASRSADIIIACTDAQFGQFIARRVTYGCQNNQVRNLSVKIICDPRPTPPETFQTKFDVRANRC